MMLPLVWALGFANAPLLYALAAAGVDAFVSDYEGMIHNFAAMFAISDGANRALTDVLGEFSAKMTA